jgi:Proteobacterial lipase chaperone protein
VLQRRSRGWLIVAATLAVAAVWLWRWLVPDTPPAPAALTPTRAAAVASNDKEPAQPAATASNVPMVAASASVPQQVPARSSRSATGRFESDAAGRLVLDERTRLAAEALVALTPADQLADALEAELPGLPPEALATARELVQRFEAYQEAQHQAFPPGQAPLVPQEGLAEFAAISALRVSYFGREQAQQLFGAEEAVTRRLLTLMSVDASPRATMEELAMRAQARYDLESSASAPTKGR